MKKFVSGFFTAIVFIFGSFAFWVDYSQYCFRHNYGDLRLIEEENKNTILIDLHKTPFNTVNEFLQTGYFSLPITGRCSTNIIKSFEKHMTYAEYHGCDSFQKFINIKNVKYENRK